MIMWKLSKIKTQQANQQPETAAQNEAKEVMGQNAVIKGSSGQG